MKTNRTISFVYYLDDFNIENYYSYKTNTKINSSSPNNAGINGNIQKFSCKKMILEFYLFKIFVYSILAGL